MLRLNYFIKKFENATQNKKQVYIIPTRAGFKYLFINFTVFLMAMSYTNNLCLLISFIMIAYFILKMLDTHKIIQDIKLNSIDVQSDYIDKIHIDIKLDAKTHESTAKYINVELQSVDKKVETKEIVQTNSKSLYMSLRNLVRNRYSFNKVKFFTTGSSGFFYVWRYYSQTIDFHAYPIKMFAKDFTFNKNTNTPSNQESEFSEHVPYQKGMNSKRIDWKIFSRVDLLYIKKHIDYNSDIIEINFNKLEGEKELRFSCMSYLIAKCFNEGKSWRLVLPSTVLESNKGQNHFQKSMEKISEA